MGSIRAPFVVLLVSLGFALPLAAATSGERDQHAHAIAALIVAGLRLPAERQLADFATAGYPSDDAALVAVLRFLYLERFSASTTTDQGASDAELKRLREQIARFQQNRTLSAGESLASVPTCAAALPDAPPVTPLLSLRGLA